MTTTQELELKRDYLVQRAFVDSIATGGGELTEAEAHTLANMALNAEVALTHWLQVKLKRIGREYGKASRTINLLRRDLAVLRQRVRHARGVCTCGAYQHVMEADALDSARYQNIIDGLRDRVERMRRERYLTPEVQR